MMAFNESVKTQLSKLKTSLSEIKTGYFKGNRITKTASILISDIDKVLADGDITIDIARKLRETLQEPINAKQVESQKKYTEVSKAFASFKLLVSEEEQRIEIELETKITLSQEINQLSAQLPDKPISIDPRAQTVTVMRAESSEISSLAEFSLSDLSTIKLDLTAKIKAIAELKQNLIEHQDIEYIMVKGSPYTITRTNEAGKPVVEIKPRIDTNNLKKINELLDATKQTIVEKYSLLSRAEIEAPSKRVRIEPSPALSDALVEARKLWQENQLKALKAEIIGKISANAEIDTLITSDDFFKIIKHDDGEVSFKSMTTDATSQLNSAPKELLEKLNIALDDIIQQKQDLSTTSERQYRDDKVEAILESYAKQHPNMKICTTITSNMDELLKEDIIKTVTDPLAEGETLFIPELTGTSELDSHFVLNIVTKDSSNNISIKQYDPLHGIEGEFDKFPPLQARGTNVDCGPLICAAASQIILDGHITNPNVNIDDLRAEHTEILATGAEATKPTKTALGPHTAKLHEQKRAEEKGIKTHTI